MINKQCHFCTNNVKDIDYKNVEELNKFIDPYGRIVSHRRSNVCSNHQRKMAIAIKRARLMALIPFLVK